MLLNEQTNEQILSKCLYAVEGQSRSLLKFLESVEIYCSVSAEWYYKFHIIVGNAPCIGTALVSTVCSWKCTLKCVSGRFIAFQMYFWDVT